MDLNTNSLEISLGKEYLEHKVFNELIYISDFYNSLSFSIMNFMSIGTKGIFNLDTYAYSSIKGTIESIYDILKKGRINDSYALLRKYYDSTIINIYTNLYLQENIDYEKLYVTEIENWRSGTKRIPEYRIISQYIREYSILKPINDLLFLDDRYKKIRKRCNDHTHYNFFRNLLANDNEIFHPQRTKYLDIVRSDIESLFIQHFAYIFYLNDHYMMSSDFIDCLDLGIQPEENAQYWVAQFIQEAFDQIIKAKRPDIAEEILKNTSMELK